MTNPPQVPPLLLFEQIGKQLALAERQAAQSEVLCLVLAGQARREQLELRTLRSALIQARLLPQIAQEG